MTPVRASIASALALLLWCAATTLAAGYITGVWPLPDPADVRYIGFHDRDALDGRPVSWARSYSKVDLPDPGWRPLRVAFDLIAPPGSAQLVVVEIGILDSIQRRVTIGPTWAREEIVVRDQPTGRRLELQLWSTVQADSKLGVGVGAVRQRPKLVSRRGVALLSGACFVGFVGWVASSRRRQTTALAITRHAAPVVRPLQPGIAMVIVGFVPMLWLGLPGRHAWWVWASVLVLAACGRLARAWLLPRTADRGFPLTRDPILELALGLSGSVTALYLVSFAVKRVAGRTAPVEGLFPFIFAAALVAVWITLMMRKHPLIQEVTWSRADAVRLASFFLVVAWLAGPHLISIHAYSSDPLQHIGWANQLRLHGFVPDQYADTGLLISYPQGFASFAYALTGMTPLAPANGVNLLPVLASATFIYVVVFGVRTLQQRRGATRSVPRDVFVLLIFAACAAAFSSAQFGMWQYFEGTGRGSASLIHLIPLALLFDLLWGFQHERAEPARPAPGKVERPALSAVEGSGLRLAVLFLSGILVLLINPGHLLVHGVISLAVLILEGWSLARSESSVRPLLAGPAVALAAGAALLLADPYWYRAIARSIGRVVPDAHIQRIDADFLQRFRDPACLRLDCIRDAIGRVNKLGSVLQPVRALITAPADLVRGRVGPGSSENRAIDVAISFPPPAHGLAVFLQIAALGGFLATVRHHRWAFVVFVFILLVAASVDLTIRRVLALVIGPGDPLLRLLPPYATRASSVFFNQALWTGLVAGVSMALIRASAGSKRWIPGLVAWGAVVSVAAVTASSGVRAAAAKVEATPGVPTLADLRDFHALEREVPPGESYLVTARVLFGNNERYVDPIDEAVTLYAQADRPTLFQFFQSYSAQYSASDYLNVCEALKAGVRYPDPLVRHNARWVVMLSASLVDPPIRQKWFCDQPVPMLFPNYKAVARRGRLTLYRLW
ncbi:MAG: hypothetical protein HY654_10240 [Acidobacteria bacterium]|nr:hypothetical protein [Acidobacteriota bacterium]